jgi:hypothetical protein
LWQSLTTHFVALDRGGRQDLVIIHPEGLRGRTLHFEVWTGLGGGRLAPRPVASSVDVEAEDWYYGADFSGDGVPDLFVKSGGRLLLYPGLAGKRQVAERAAWSFGLPVPPPLPKGAKGAKKSADDEDGGEGGSAEGARRAGAPAEGRLGALVDLAGDGRPALVLTVADALGRSQVVTVQHVAGAVPAAGPDPARAGGGAQ